VKIAQKLLLGSVALSIAVIVTGAVGYYASVRIGRDFEHAVNRTQPVVTALETVRFHAVRAHGRAHEGATPGDRHGGAASLAEMLTALRDAGHGYEQIVKAYFPAEIQAAGVILATIARFESAALRAAAASRAAGVSGDARAALDRALEQLLEQTAEAMTHEAEEFREYQAGVDETVQRSALAIIGTSVLTFIAALFIGLAIARRISRPIVALAVTARSFGRGDLEARARAGSSDEVGELGRSFNEMAARLAQTMVSRDYVEAVIESIADAVLVLDSAGKIERANAAARAMLGGEGPVAWEAQLRDLLAAVSRDPNGGHPVEATIAVHGGETIPVEVSRSVLRENSRPIGSVLLIRDIRERKRAEQRLHYMASYDELTGLPNRSLFGDRLGQTLAQAKRSGREAGCIFIDLDRFKAVNDTYGHGIGDKLLNLVAQRLQECVRSVDTVGRLSGDEFAIAISNLAKADDANLVARKVVSALAHPFDLDGHPTYMTASLGIALYPIDGEDPAILLKNADTAMFRAKQLGRNNFQFYLPQMNERAAVRLQMETQLRIALERGQFLLHYQPKANLASGEISGFEALLRWQHPERGLVPPLEFISILEDTGLIVAVGEWVLRTACAQIGHWQAQGMPPRPVAVNLSARQFQDKNLGLVIAAIIADSGIDPGLLEIELTESMLMNNAEEATRTLNEINAGGVRLAMDDFGTGYSSLAYLRRFPLDVLKIDRAFIRNVATDPDDAAIVLAMISLAHSMKLEVVAEGVETEAQMSFLRMHGCDEIQGYYFARPMPAAECTRALAENRFKLPATSAVPDAPAVLVVDDSHEDIEILKRALAPDGYRIVAANSAAAGFEALAQIAFQIVISDYMMPGMTGVEFLAGVRTLYPDAVRIVMSGVGDMATLTDAVNEASVHKYVAKDWDEARIRAAVREAHLRHRARPGSSEAAP
jgi:diguanylate cyclase (GGDEF)-like protein/PAS domain S-box-containing protein